MTTSHGDLDAVRACDLGSATVVVHYETGAVQVLATGKYPRPVVAGRKWEASWGVQELPMGFAEFPRVPPVHRLIAAGALLVVIVVGRTGRRHLRMHRMLRLVRHVSGYGRPPATVTEAERAVHAVRGLGLFSPVRVACLEESVAAVLTLAALGRGARWCHGAIGDPIRLHAWIEAEGFPVAEPDSTRRCTALLAIPTMKEAT
ncbi:lasso peptide biosynthesis B2 protein [Nocardiopsis sp. NPDC049922]|uniref:lasso peptide biosynthesis B2 protein n=1 Tax=Nocardiopsis sp. NPDC049922 TaxID=3155157 RepID=UPI0033DC221F